MAQTYRSFMLPALLYYSCVCIFYLATTTTLVAADDGGQMVANRQPPELPQQQTMDGMVRGGGEADVLSTAATSQIVAYVGRLAELRIEDLLMNGADSCADRRLLSIQDLPLWLLHDRQRGTVLGLPTSEHLGQSYTFTLLCQQPGGDGRQPVGRPTVSVIPFPQSDFHVGLPSSSASRSSPSSDIDAGSPSFREELGRNDVRLGPMLGVKNRPNMQNQGDEYTRPSNPDHNTMNFLSGNRYSPTLGSNLAKGVSNTFIVHEESKQCAQNHIASLVLCLSPDTLNVSQRVQVLLKAADFLSTPSHVLTWVTSPDGSLRFMGREYSVQSGGASEGSNCTETINSELFWPLSCSAGRHVAEFSKILKHNVEVGRLDREVGIEVLGWYVASKGHRRRRRQVSNRTPVPTPTLYPPSATVPSSQPLLPSPWPSYTDIARPSQPRQAFGSDDFIFSSQFLEDSIFHYSSQITPSRAFAVTNTIMPESAYPSSEEDQHQSIPALSTEDFTSLSHDVRSSAFSSDFENMLLNRSLRDVQSFSTLLQPSQSGTHPEMSRSLIASVATPSLSSAMSMLDMGETVSQVPSSSSMFGLEPSSFSFQVESTQGDSVSVMPQLSNSILPTTSPLTDSQFPSLAHQHSPVTDPTVIEDRHSSNMELMSEMLSPSPVYSSVSAVDTQHILPVMPAYMDGDNEVGSPDYLSMSAFVQSSWPSTLSRQHSESEMASSDVPPATPGTDVWSSVSDMQVLPSNDQHSVTDGVQISVFLETTGTNIPTTYHTYSMGDSSSSLLSSSDNPPDQSVILDSPFDLSLTTENSPAAMTVEAQIQQTVSQASMFLVETGLIVSGITSFPSTSAGPNTSVSVLSDLQRNAKDSINDIATSVPSSTSPSSATVPSISLLLDPSEVSPSERTVVTRRAEVIISSSANWPLSEDSLSQSLLSSPSPSSGGIISVTPVPTSPIVESSLTISQLLVDEGYLFHTDSSLEIEPSWSMSLIVATPTSAVDGPSLGLREYLQTHVTDFPMIDVVTSAFALEETQVIPDIVGATDMPMNDSSMESYIMPSPYDPSESDAILQTSDLIQSSHSFDDFETTFLESSEVESVSLQPTSIDPTQLSSLSVTSVGLDMFTISTSFDDMDESQTEPLWSASSEIMSETLSATLKSFSSLYVDLITNATIMESISETQILSPTLTESFSEIQSSPIVTQSLDDIQLSLSMTGSISESVLLPSQIDAFSETLLVNTVTDNISEPMALPSQTEAISETQLSHTLTKSISETMILPSQTEAFSKTLLVNTVMDNISEPMALPSQTEAISETQLSHTLTKSISETMILPSQTEAFSETLLVNTVMDNISEPMALPSQTEAISETQLSHILTKSISETMILPSQTEAFSETLLVNTVTDNISEPMALPSQTEAISETQLSHTLTKSIFETTILPSQTEAFSETLLVNTVTDNVSEPLALPSQTEAISETQLSHTLTESIYETMILPSQTEAISETQLSDAFTKSISGTIILPGQTEAISETQISDIFAESIFGTEPLPSQTDAILDTPLSTPRTESMFETMSSSYVTSSVTDQLFNVTALSESEAVSASVVFTSVTTSLPVAIATSVSSTATASSTTMFPSTLPGEVSTSEILSPPDASSSEVVTVSAAGPGLTLSATSTGLAVPASSPAITVAIVPTASTTTTIVTTVSSPPPTTTATATASQFTAVPTTTRSITTTTPSTSPATTSPTTDPSTSSTAFTTSPESSSSRQTGQTEEQQSTASVTATVDRPNSPPIVQNAMNFLPTMLGRYFEWQIPEDMFYDAEDGNTRSLSLTLTLSYDDPLPPNFWVQLDRSRQVVYGLPLVADLDMGYHSVVLVATDSKGLGARNPVSLYVNSSSFAHFTHRFVMTFGVDFSQFMRRRDNVTKLLKKIGTYYGDQSAEYVTVVDVSVGSFVLSWTNSSLSGSQCANRSIHSYLNRMVRRDGSIRSAFNRHIGKYLKLRSVLYRPEGACLHPPTPKSTTPTTTYPADGSQPRSAESPDADVLKEIILPVLAALLLVLLLIIVALFVHRCRQQRGTGNLETLEKDILASDRSPVILPGELPDVETYNVRPKKPAVLPYDPAIETSSFPRNRPSTYQHYRQIGSFHRGANRPNSYAFDDDRLHARPVTVIFNNFDSAPRHPRPPGYWNERSEETSPNIRVPAPYLSTTSV